MSEIAVPIEEFQSLVRPLIGLTVSLPWKGYGSAICLELGELAPPKSPLWRMRNGEACIAVSWDWRVEAGGKILYGSSNSRPQIDSGIAVLKGSTVQSISISGQVPELAVQFSNGHLLRSMAMVTGDPEWSVRIEPSRWVYAKSGCLLIGRGESSLTKEEEDAFALAERTAARWGTPIAEPKGGLCADCYSFVRIDGEGSLLDYGVCVREGGPFDGRVLQVKSGCPFFDGGDPS